MRPDFDHQAELHRLLDALCEDSLSSDDAERLSAMLRSDASARQLYRDVFSLHASLRRVLRSAERKPGEVLAEPAEGQLDSADGIAARCDEAIGAMGPVALENGHICASPDSAAKPLPASPVLGFLSTAVHLSATWLSSPKVLAIAVIGALATYFVGLMISIAITRAYVDPRNPKDAAEAISPSAARIIAASGCRWQDRSPRAGLSGKLPTGTSHLVEGIVELEFDGGVRVRIEGPAEFAARSGQRMQLVRGRIVAYVPKQARGFTVGTPTAEVIDLGTEFGVEVDGQGSTDLHVIRGRVEVKPVSDPVSKPGEAQPRSRRVSADGAVRVSAGEAVRVSASGAAPQRIALDSKRFDAVRSSTAAEASKDKRSARSFTEGRPIWLGNLFDDYRYLDKSLAEAMFSDTFKATPIPDGTLGVERVTYGGDPMQQIAPGVLFDCSNLGWKDGNPGSHPIGNDAISTNGGGIRLQGEAMETDVPKREEGIGMHANVLITFDLDEIRAAGELQGRALRFVCDRAGINDDAHTAKSGSVHMVVLVSSERAVKTALVDGTPGKLIEHEHLWSLASVPKEPLRVDGPYFSADVPLPADARFLTLLSASAGDDFWWDHGVWVGARLEVVR